MLRAVRPMLHTLHTDSWLSKGAGPRPVHAAQAAWCSWRRAFASGKARIGPAAPAASTPAHGQRAQSQDSSDAAGLLAHNRAQLVARLDRWQSSKELQGDTVTPPTRSRKHSEAVGVSPDAGSHTGTRQHLGSQLLRTPDAVVPTYLGSALLRQQQYQQLDPPKQPSHQRQQHEEPEQQATAYLGIIGASMSRSYPIVAASTLQLAETNTVAPMGLLGSSTASGRRRRSRSTASRGPLEGYSPPEQQREGWSGKAYMAQEDLLLQPLLPAVPVAAPVPLLQPKTGAQAAWLSMSEQAGVSRGNAGQQHQNQPHGTGAQQLVRQTRPLFLQHQHQQQQQPSQPLRPMPPQLLFDSTMAAEQPAPQLNPQSPSNRTTSSRAAGQSASEPSSSTAPQPPDPDDLLADIAEQLEERGIELLRLRFGTHRPMCPECAGGSTGESSFAVTINENGAAWCCHRATCGFKGGVKARLGGAKHWRPASESRAIVEPAKVILPRTDRLRPLNAELLSWFASRGISQSTLLDQRNRISMESRVAIGTYYAEQPEVVNMIAYPFLRDGKVVNIKYRQLPKKFTQTKGGEQVLYGVDDIKGQPVAILVEGEMDKLALNQAGLWNVASVPNGATLPGSENKFRFMQSAEAALAGCQLVLLGTDSDAPGQALAEQLVQQVGPERCGVLQWPEGCKDANAVLMLHDDIGLRDWVYAEGERISKELG